MIVTDSQPCTSCGSIMVSDGSALHCVICAPRRAPLTHDAQGKALYVDTWEGRCEVHDTNVRAGGSCPRCLIEQYEEPNMGTPRDATFEAHPPSCCPPPELGIFSLPTEALAAAMERVNPPEDPNPKQRYGDMKVPLHLVPPALAIGAAKALGEGAKKYGAWNFRHTRVEALTYVGAIQRHIAAYLDGEDIDPESLTGKRHLDGIAACVAILLDAEHLGTLIDNRPPKGPAPRLLRSPGFVEPEAK